MTPPFSQPRLFSLAPRIRYAAAAALLAGPLAWSQAAPPAAPTGSTTALDQYHLQLPVPLVLEDLVVLDRNDRPVHGLKASDLIITENNKPVTIQKFEEHSSDGQPAAPLHRLRDMGPNVFTNLTEAAGSGPLNILLLDALNTPMTDQAYVRQQMLKYLKTLQPGTRIAIFGLSTRLYILQGFTSNPEVLKAAIDWKHNKERASPLLDDAVSGEPVEQMSDIMSETMGTDPAAASVLANVQQFEANMATERTRQRMIYTLEAMNALARYLSGIPGRKNLIWFSGSFPLSILPDGSLPDPFGATADFADDVRKTTDLLVSSRVAVYPVDGRGLFTNPAFSASQGGAAFGGRGNPSASMAAQGNFLTRLSEEHATMDQMADETGGKAFYNTNGLKEAVQKAIEFGSNYYSFVYTPPGRTWDGSYRKISVKVNQPGLHLLYRHGYYADDPAEQTHGQKVLPQSAMATAMMRGGPDATQVLFDAMVVPADAPTGKITEGSNPDPKLMKPPYKSYTVNYLVDLHNVAFTEAANGSFHGALELSEVIYNADGDLVNENGSRISANLPAGRYAQLLAQGLHYSETVEAPAKGQYFLRLGIHDPNGDRVGSMEIPLSSLKSRQAMIDAAQKAAAPAAK